MFPFPHAKLVPHLLTSASHLRHILEKSKLVIVECPSDDIIDIAFCNEQMSQKSLISNHRFFSEVTCGLM